MGSNPACGLGFSDERNKAGDRWGGRLFFQFMFDRETNSSVKDLSLSVLAQMGAMNILKGACSIHGRPGL